MAQEELPTAIPPLHYLTKLNQVDYRILSMHLRKYSTSTVKYTIAKIFKTNNLVLPI